MAVTEKQRANLRPPIKKGEVRNPKGKPVGTLNANTILNRWLTVITKENGVEKGKEEMSQLDAVVAAVIVKAKKGDVPAANFLFDRLVGRAVTPVNMNIGAEDSFFKFMEGVAQAKKKRNV